MERIFFDQPDVDDRDFSEPRDICRECGADLVDDDHEPSCSYSDNPEPAFGWEPQDEPEGE